MKADQHPIDSRFGAHSTAEDVLADIDLEGKVALVTGGHSGLGLETSKALAKAGAQVVVLARRREAAEEALKALGNVEILEGDLADLTSIRAAAETFLNTHRHLDVVINNAGIMACPETRVGGGWEAQFAVNHLGHFALVCRLWPALVGGARVISVSSAGHHLSGIRWQDLRFGQGYDKWLAYGQSKTANALFAVHLDTIGTSRNVRAFSLHPGKIFTPLQRHLAQEEMIEAGWLDKDGKPSDPTFKTTQQGAATQVWAATSPKLAGMGGVYCEDCDIAELDVSETPTFHGARDYAIDPGYAARLWALSVEFAGVDAVD